MKSPAALGLATRQIIIGIALVAIAALLWLNRTVIVLAFGALLFATVLRAAAAPIARLTGISARWSVVAAVLIFAALLGGLIWLFGAQVSDEFVQLRERLPHALADVRSWLEQSPRGKSIVRSLEDLPQDGLMAKAGLAAGAVAGVIANTLLIVFAGLYFALDPSLYRRGVLRLLPLTQRERVGAALDEAASSLRRWLIAQLVLMATVGTLTGIGLAIAGVPLAFSLALLIGLLEFIPLIGPILGAVPGILLGFTQGPEVALYALFVYVAVQQIENNLLTPVVQRWAVELPPAVALFSIIVCGITFGPVGIIFATPLAVVTMTLIRRLYVEDTLEAGAGARDGGGLESHP